MTEEICRRIFETTREGIVFTNQAGLILRANPAFASLLGFDSTEAILGKNLTNLLPFESVGLSLSQIAGGGPGHDYRHEFQIVTPKSKSGITLTALISSIGTNGESGILGLFWDITDSKKSEISPDHHSRISPAALKTAGFIHDCNNFMAAILGNLGLAKLEVRPGTRLHDLLGQAEKAAQKAIDLAGRSLEGPENDELIQGVVSVDAVIQEAATFFLRTTNVQFQVDIPEDLHRIKANESQILRALSNFLINAQQAMPDGGMVRIVCQNITLNENEAGGQPTDYVKISISDQGKGISRNNLTMIFEPLFTTKENGSGLGLATSSSIIRRHRGQILVRSAENGGTTFDIILPAYIESDAAKCRPSDSGIPVKGRILVVDDEDDIRAVLAAMLRMLGYDSSPAASGEEAISLYRKALDEDGRYDAVILDLDLPGEISGVEILSRLFHIDPKAKGIVFTGHFSDPVVSNFKIYGFRGRLLKPFKLTDLERVLDETLAKALANGNT